MHKSLTAVDKLSCRHLPLAKYCRLLVQNSLKKYILDTVVPTVKLPAARTTQVEQ